MAAWHRPPPKPRGRRSQLERDSIQPRQFRSRRIQAFILGWEGRLVPLVELGTDAVFRLAG